MKYAKRTQQTAYIEVSQDDEDRLIRLSGVLEMTLKRIPGAHISGTHVFGGRRLGE